VVPLDNAWSSSIKNLYSNRSVIRNSQAKICNANSDQGF